MSLKDYEFIKSLGREYSASISLVKKLKDNTLYRMKKVELHLITKKENENLLKEAELYVSLEHKNIIVYKEAFFDNKSNTFNIVMEYTDDGDLEDKIEEFQKKNNYFSEEEIWSTLIQILEGLKYLHQNCIILRDLNCRGIFLTKNGCVKIYDLITNQDYEILGTPYYLPPEYWNDQRYDYKSNIWSVGCVIYKMCTFIPPFIGKNIRELYKKITSGIYKPIPIQYSNELKTIIKQMLEINPKNRPFSSELLENPIIKKKIVELGIYNKNNNKEKATLMKTNKISFNMPQINKELPQKKNEKEKVQLNDANKTIKKAFLKNNQFKIKLKEEKNRDNNKNIKQKGEKTNNKDLNQKGKKTLLKEEKKNKINNKDMKKKNIEKNKNDIENKQKDEEKKSNENKREKDIEIKLYDEEKKNHLLNEKFLQLEKELNEEKEKNLIEININKELNVKILKLTDELINEKQNVQKLKDCLNSLNAKNLKLEELIDTHIKEINKLKSKLNEKEISEERVLAICLSSFDENINFILPCKSTEQFIRIEEKFYNEYPEYRDKNIYFIINGNEIKQFKTLEENNIKSGSIINIHYITQ